MNKTIIILRILVFILMFTQPLAAQKFSDLSDIEKKEEYTKKTEQRIKDLEINIKTIGDKGIDRATKTEAVNVTLKYFVSEDKVFQVSSINRPDIRTYKIREYLNRLMILPYYRVEIDWFETRWITKFRKAPDGKEYGVVRIFQVFKGYDMEGNLAYKDITSKDIEVEIEVVEMDLGSTTRDVLMVKLGDIKVIETK